MPVAGPKARQTILVLFGTRPEAIKMAPVIRELQARSALLVIVCVSAQHREMLDQALAVFGIEPDIDLDVMRPGQDLVDVTCGVLQGVRQALLRTKPDAVLVHGDTTTALAGALACFYARVPVGHVEAGLRTNDINSPFPEEFNRQVISKVASWHFAPTLDCRNNLMSEGVAADSIFVTGNTVIDALHDTLARYGKHRMHANRIDTVLDTELPFDWHCARSVLITGHRRESFGAGFDQICQAITRLAHDYPEVQFVYPVHLNPAVRKPVLTLLGGIENVHLVAPLDYEPFAVLMQHCYFVLTDSGGIQEEAPSLNKPVLVMRDVTERPEGVRAGGVRLVGTSVASIVSACSQLLDDPVHHGHMADIANPYGDSFAAGRIADILFGALVGQGS